MEAEMILADRKISTEQIERIERKLAFYRCEEGEAELFNLMVDAGFFEIIKDTDKLALRNYAVARLTELGFNQEDKIRKAIHEMLYWPAVLDRERKETSNGND